MTERSEGADRVGHIETQGVDLIPDELRHSRPANIFYILLGGQMNISVLVLGWVPITFGLGWWGAASSLMVGVTIGSVIASSMALLGPRTGTNSPVSSGAFFGVVGRLFGSFLSVLICLGFFALAVWAGGQALVEGAHRLIGTPNSDLALAVGYILIMLVSSLAAIMGHANMAAVQKILIPTAGIIFVVSCFVLLPKFMATSHQGGNYILGSFWPTWWLSVTTAVAGPLGYSMTVNDWARYISPKRWKPRNAAIAFGLGLFVSIGFADVMGAYVASMFTDPGTDFVTGFIQISPPVLAAFLAIVGVVGTYGQGSMMLYAMGLDVSSLVPVLRRVIATILLSLVALAFVFVGTLVIDVRESVHAFLVIFEVMEVPWVLICIIGHFWRRGQYNVEDLQVFNRRERGGVYWFWHGWSVRTGMIWMLSVVVGLMFSNNSLYVGPLFKWTGGIDISLVISGILGAILYTMSLILFSEQRPRLGERSVSRRVTV